MKKSILCIAVLLMVSTIQAQKRIKGNGNMTSITRTTSDYDAVKFAGSFDYVLVAGTEGNIKIEGEENLLPYIITEVKKGTLIIKIENRVNLNTSRTKSIKITVPFESITEVSLSGSGNLWNEETIAIKAFKVSVAGSGEAKLDVSATTIDASVAGSGELALKGKTNTIKISVAGSGEFKGFDLDATDADVSVTGSGSADLVCNGHLKASITGSGEISYKGNPSTKDTKVVGSGSISN
jgi:hypothetical protein